MSGFRYDVVFAISPLAGKAIMTRCKMEVAAGNMRHQVPALDRVKKRQAAPDKDKCLPLPARGSDRCGLAAIIACGSCLVTMLMLGTGCLTQQTNLRESTNTTCQENASLIVQSALITEEGNDSVCAISDSCPNGFCSNAGTRITDGVMTRAEFREFRTSIEMNEFQQEISEIFTPSGEMIEYPDGFADEILEKQVVFVNNRCQYSALLNYEKNTVTVQDTANKIVTEFALSWSGYYAVIAARTKAYAFGNFLDGANPELRIISYTSNDTITKDYDWRSYSLSNSEEWLAITTGAPSHLLILNNEGDEIWKYRIGDNSSYAPQGYRIVFSADDSMIAVIAPKKEGWERNSDLARNAHNVTYYFSTRDWMLMAITEDK